LGAAAISGTVSGKIPVYAVLGYADPTGGSNYDAQIGAAVPGANRRFSVVIPAPTTSKADAGEFRLVACCVNGAKTSDAGDNSKPAFPFALDHGCFDLAPTKTSLDLMAALVAARSGTLSEEARRNLDPRAQEILRRLLTPVSTKDKSEPAEIPATTTSLPLSDTRPQSAATGWGGVHYDRLPPQDPLVSGGRLFTHGIYAHAEAKHVYRLAGSWKRLRGQSGIGDNGYGPVEFVIRGDGQELCHSGVVKPGAAVTFNVDVSGIAQLELLTHLTPAGAGGAWGVWLEPLLER
ncbi:MAG TPA: NPCBM/NEW2 domain-containing protein, partial [Planctomycetota bacterium]|nr:NPCBM/NEW2 domain-containing protein [Planctomycetota bacterium]